MTRPERHRASQRQQRGVATLIVVMVLLFVVTMVAAYTSRNLIFEQRTGVNQYRSTQALEAAQAGLEWAKGMLNQGRIDAFCAPSTTTTDTTFRERYLSVDSNGFITPLFHSVGSGPVLPANNLTPTCVFNGTGWNCSCPSSGAPSLSAPSGVALAPAFRVRIGYPYPGTYATAPGSVRIEVVGCTALSDTCLSFVGQGDTGEGRALATELLSLAGGLPSPPMAALTAGGNVNPSGTMAVYNTDIPSGGVTIQAGGAVTAGSLLLVSVPGTAGNLSIVDNDSTLIGSDANRFFAGVFNMWPATFRQQPAAVVLDASVSGCVSAGCNAGAVRTALSLNPGRVIWVEGDLTVDSAGDIGSAAAPALLVVTGNLSFTTAATIYGMVYVRSAPWTVSGTGTVRGAVIAEGAVAGAGTPTLVYDADVLRRLRLNQGSFVMVPGGWKDYCSTPSGLQDAGQQLGC